MPTFTVAIEEKRYAIAYVEADTEQEAEAKAKSDWEDDNENIEWSEAKELIKCEADGFFND